MIHLLPIQPVDANDIYTLAQMMPFKTVLLPAVDTPVDMFNTDRGQYLATGFLARCKNPATDVARASQGAREPIRRQSSSALKPHSHSTRGSREPYVVGITDVDLYVEGLNFIFGLAEVRGRACVISLHRLKAKRRGLYIERALKEAVHELGHVIGLAHCGNPLCVMWFSNTLADTDRKSSWYCARCERLNNAMLSELLEPHEF